MAIHCVVETETEIGPNCTLVEMARQQGEGVLRRSEARVLESGCVKRDGVWKLTRAVFRPWRTPDALNRVSIDAPSPDA